MATQSYRAFGWGRVMSIREEHQCHRCNHLLGQLAEMQVELNYLRNLRHEHTIEAVFADMKPQGESNDG